jgi:hypothetical protein
MTAIFATDHSRRASPARTEIAVMDIVAIVMLGSIVLWMLQHVDELFG